MHIENAKNERKIQLFCLSICFIIFGALLLFAAFSRPDTIEQIGLYYERGRVIDVSYEATSPFRYQMLYVEVLSGEFQGMTIEAQNNLMNPRLSPFSGGERVILEFTEQAIQIESPDRSMAHFFLVALFLILLGVVGGKRGLLSMAGLLFSLTAILFILVPLTLAGYSAILIAMIVGILIITTTIILLAGINPKSISAIFGCTVGVLIAAFFAFIAGELAFISGYHIGEAGLLRGAQPNLRLSGIFTSGVIIAAIGAISDTSMTIASAMEEVKLANPTISMKDLATAGFNVGRDAMGTMSNTLILAFIGSSFGLILLLTSMDISWIQFINDDLIGVEIIQGIAGSIGIVLAVPITTFIAAKLFSSK